MKTSNTLSTCITLRLLYMCVHMDTATQNISLRPLVFSHRLLCNCYTASKKPVKKLMGKFKSLLANGNKRKLTILIPGISISEAIIANTPQHSRPLFIPRTRSLNSWAPHANTVDPQGCCQTWWMFKSSTECVLKKNNIVLEKKL